MAEVERLFTERSLVEARVKQLQEKLNARDGAIRPSLARVKQYDNELQCYYKKYQRVYGELLSAFPAERFAELDADCERFEEIHFDACVLVETLLLSFPTTDNRYQHSRAFPSSCFTAPRWRSRSPSPTTEQAVPIPDVMKEPNTSPREFSPEKQLFPAQANEVKLNPVCGPALVRSEGDLTEVTKSKSAALPIVPPSDVPPIQKFPCEKRVSSADASARPVCGPALVRSDGDLAEVIQCKSAPTPIVPPSVAPTLQKYPREESVPTQREEVPTKNGQPAHRKEDSTRRGKVPTKCEEVTTVAYLDETIPPSKQREHPANSTKTTPENFHVGNESTQFVDNVNISSCDATNPIPVPINLVGIHPKPTPFQRGTGCGALPKSFLMPPGFHPPPRLASMPTDVLPVPKKPAASSQSFQCATGSRPVLQRFPCVGGFRTIPIEFPSAIGYRLVAKRFPHVARFRQASKQLSRLAGFHPTPQRFPCVAGSIPALKYSSSLTGSNSIEKPFQRVFPDVAGFPPVMKQPFSVMGYQPVSQRFLSASVFHLVAKKFQCVARIHPIREQSSCATGPRSVLKPFPPSVGSHSAPEKPPVVTGFPPPVPKPPDVTGIPPPVPKPPDVTGIPPPVPKSFRLPIEMHPLLIFLLPAGIPPVCKIVLSSTEIPASFKPVLTPAGIPPMIKPQKMSEMCPAKHPRPVPTGIHPVSKWLRCSTTIPPIVMLIQKTAGIHPVREPTPMPTGKRPVLREAPNLRLTKKMMPPVNPTGDSMQAHTKSRPEKPPNEAPMRRRASEAIPECVSRTHPPEDVHQVVSKLSICGVCLFPILAQSGFPSLPLKSPTQNDIVLDEFFVLPVVNEFS